MSEISWTRSFDRATEAFPRYTHAETGLYIQKRRSGGLHGGGTTYVVCPPSHGDGKPLAEQWADVGLPGEWKPDAWTLAEAKVKAAELIARIREAGTR